MCITQVRFNLFSGCMQVYEAMSNQTTALSSISTTTHHVPGRYEEPGGMAWYYTMIIPVVVGVLLLLWCMVSVLPKKCRNVQDEESPRESGEEVHFRDSSTSGTATVYSVSDQPPRYSNLFGSDDVMTVLPDSNPLPPAYEEFVKNFNQIRDNENSGLEDAGPVDRLERSNKSLQGDQHSDGILERSFRPPSLSLSGQTNVSTGNNSSMTDLNGATEDMKELSVRRNSL